MEECILTKKEKDDFLKILDFEVAHANLEDDDYYKAKRKWLNETGFKPKEKLITRTLFKLFELFNQNKNF